MLYDQVGKLLIVVGLAIVVLSLLFFLLGKATPLGGTSDEHGHTQSAEASSRGGLMDGSPMFSVGVRLVSAVFST